MNFIDKVLLDEGENTLSTKTENNSDEQNLIEESDNPEQNVPESDETLAVTYSKLSMSSKDDAIPIISSSETDTSSSESDENEDASESSTNYNILDDTLSLLDPSSPEVENYPLLGNSQIKLYPTTLPSFASRTLLNILFIFDL